jgi:2'-5' RNA ligase
VTAKGLAGRTGSVRSFVALPCPESLRREIARGIAEWRGLGADVAWADPERIHLTLRFLGDADPASLARLNDGLRSIAGACRAIEARAGTVGAFPGRGRPRVLWLGLSSDGAVERLAEAVELAARGAGFPAENRPFVPHLTLGRVRSPRGVGRAVAALRRWEVDGRPRRIGSLVLYRSRLGPGGARHEPLSTYLLEVPGG